MNKPTPASLVPGDAAPLDSAEQAELIRYGITRVPAAVYHLGDYRYTKLADAVAEAKRSSGAKAYRNR